MTRCGVIAILGAPNAGKSTLLNRLIGGKVSIVTPKVQTTRVRVRGVCMYGDSQLIFTDTPGIFAANRAYERGMVDEAWAGAGDADAVLLLVDAGRGLDAEAQAIISALREKSGKARLSLALNKVDTIKKPELLSLATQANEYGLFEQIFMISATKGTGVEEVKKYLAGVLPKGPWLYPEDQLTDVPMRELAAEITREKLFLGLNQELPYSLTVETESWTEQKNGVVKVMQVITVEREGQKKIIIGEKGATIKRVGMSARIELEAELQRKVHLELFVKVDEKWKERALRR